MEKVLAGNKINKILKPRLDVSNERSLKKIERTVKGVYWNALYKLTDKGDNPIWRETIKNTNTTLKIAVLNIHIRHNNVGNRQL